LDKTKDTQKKGKKRAEKNTKGRERTPRSIEH